MGGGCGTLFCSCSSVITTSYFIVMPEEAGANCQVGRGFLVLRANTTKSVCEKYRGNYRFHSRFSFIFIYQHFRCSAGPTAKEKPHMRHQISSISAPDVIKPEWFNYNVWVFDCVLIESWMGGSLFLMIQRSVIC